MKAFETFKLGDLRFLAIHKPNGVHIVDENGGNHGRYYSIKSFKSFAAKGDTQIGKCVLTTRAHEAKVVQ